MKTIITIFISLGVVVLLGYFSFDGYTNSRLNHVEQKLIERNTDITAVDTINSKGKWGEWFSDYAAIVEMGGLKYRVWIDDAGNITDKEPLY